MTLREKKEEKKMKVCDIVMKLENDFGKQPAKSRGMSYKDIATKWVNDMPRLVLLNSTMNPSSDGSLPIKLSTIKRSVFSHKVKNIRLVDWFNEHYPLWTEIKKGFSLQNGMKEYTTVEVGPTWLTTLEDMCPEFILESYRKSVEGINDFDDIQINLDNLIAYYKHTKTTYDNGQVNFFRYAFEALTIIKLAIAYDKFTTCSYTGEKTYFIPQHYEFSDFGRKYYKGNVRLQSCNEMVRHGALGQCYALDINASVYSYYLQKAKDYELSDEIIAVVCKIIDRKDEVRNKLANTLTNTNATQEQKIKLVKKALTAMGFGARVDNSRGAIKDIIYNKKDREAFLDHDIVKQLSVFYKTLTTEVIKSIDHKNNANYKAELRSNPKFLADKVRNHPSSPKYDATKLTTKFTSFKTSTYMSYLYQQEETRIIQAVMEGLETYGNKTLLWVHDGIYVKNKPDMQLINAVLKLEETTLTFSCEEVNRWDKDHKDDDWSTINQIKIENEIMNKKTLFTL